MSVEIKGSGIIPKEFRKDIIRFHERLAWEMSNLLTEFIHQGKAAKHAYSKIASKKREEHGLQTSFMDFLTNDAARASTSVLSYSFGEPMLTDNPSDNMSIRAKIDGFIVTFVEESAIFKWEETSIHRISNETLLNNSAFQTLITNILNLMIKEGLLHRE